MLRYVKWLFLGIGAVLVLLLVLTSALLSTEWGSRLLVHQVLVRTPLDAGRVEGNLLTGLEFSHLEYRPESGDSHYRAEALRFRWQPLALLFGTVSVQSLSAEQVSLLLPETQESPEKEPAQAITDWPDIDLPVMVELGEVELNNILIQRGDTRTRLARLGGSFRLGPRHLDLEEGVLVGENFYLGLQGQVEPSYPYTADLGLAWRYEQPMTSGGPLVLKGRGQLGGNLESLRLEHQLQAPLNMRSQADFKPNLGAAGKTPQLRLTNRWRGQSPPSRFWPINLPRPETQGELILNGWLDDYRIELQMDASAEQWPRMQINLEAEGDRQQAALESLQFITPEGELNSQGLIHWSPELRWDLAVEAREVDPSLWVSGWPGKLDVAFTTKGGQQADGWWASLHNLDASGDILGAELAASGAVNYKPGQVIAEGLSVSLGENRLGVKGKLGLPADSSSPALDIHWSLSAPQLSQIGPALKGSLQAEGTLGGALDEPLVQASVEANELQWQDIRLQALEAGVDRQPESPYRLSMEARNLTISRQNIEALTLTGSGSLQRHSLQAKVRSDELGQVVLSVLGGYANDRWRGFVPQTSVQLRELATFDLLAPARLTLGGDQVTLGNFCLKPQRPSGSGSELATRERLSSLCLRGQWQAQTGFEANAELLAVPLRLANAFLPPQLQLRGALSGAASYRAPVGGTPTGELSLSTDQAAVRHVFGPENVNTYPLEALTLRAGLKNQQLNAEWVTNLGEYGEAQGQLDLALTSGELAGHLTAESSNLAPVELALPQLRDVTGQLQLDLDLSGTLDAPQWGGRALLSSGSAKVPEAGLELEQIRIELQGENGQLGLEGSLVSGGGTLNLTANLADPYAADWQLQAQLTGTKVEVLDNQEISAKISPQLTLEASAEAIRLEGEALIPEALANIQTLPETATRVSDDVVLEQSQEEEASDEKTPVYVDLQLALGEDVRFEGFGLEARLVGEIGLLHTPERGLLTTGEVGVVEGYYSAYGQDLTIERGRLIFQGPYDNPGLDIRAVREVDEYEVGLEIGGSLQGPRSQVFSNPSLPDSEAMAMLFTGRPLSGGTDADGAMLLNAIGGLGLERSGFITSEIARAFDLDEFTVVTEDEVTESSLFIGKYLTPRLFVRYVVGLFDQTNRLGFEYDLTPSLRLEGQTGVDQSVDLIYNLER